MSVASNSKNISGFGDEITKYEYKNVRTPDVSLCLTCHWNNSE